MGSIPISKEIKHIFILNLILLLLPISLLIFHFRSPFDPLLFLHHFSRSKNGGLKDSCDYSYGKWVWDETYKNSLYDENCRFLDPGFQCRKNGRKDTGYRHWRWKPHDCDLPLFNATEMLERSKNKIIVFVGDSIGRNQWESLMCMLSNSIKNTSHIYEQFDNPITKHRGFLSMVFKDYNLKVEYYRAPLLVAVDRFRTQNVSNGSPRGAIRVDKLPRLANRWARADVLVLNSGHWWNIEKTIKSGNYFQVGRILNRTMDINEAFQRSMETIISWIFISPKLHKSHIFIRNYSPSHFINGTWDKSGTCEAETKPFYDINKFGPEPWTNRVISNVIEEMRKNGMKARVLNVTYMTEFRKDGHPSKHREPGFPPTAPQDCSHWCLPGVPDAWNELLYANLLSMGYDDETRILQY